MEKLSQSVRIPTAALGTWAEVSLEIKARLSERLRRPIDALTAGDVVGEMIRIAAYHIYVEGYPTPDRAQAKLEMQKANLREKAETARLIETQASLIETQYRLIAALEGKLETKSDS